MTEYKCQKQSIRETDWDCLVIFDACRHDAYDRITDHDVEIRRSPATATPPWIKEVWLDEPRKDVTYISGHPITESEDRMYGDLSEYVDYVPAHRDAWDDLLGTTRPKQITEVVQDAEPPVVAHYLQPHNPFIGELSIRAGRVQDWRGCHRPHGSVPRVHEYDPDVAVYRMVEAGEISENAIRDAYENNVWLAIKEREKLIDMFDTVVFTADHGESLGEDDYWGHWLDNDAVLNVPWDVYES